MAKVPVVCAKLKWIHALSILKIIINISFVWMMNFTQFTLRLDSIYNCLMPAFLECTLHLGTSILPLSNARCHDKLWLYKEIPRVLSTHQ